jgi:hypothetical protein
MPVEIEVWNESTVTGGGGLTELDVIDRSADK